MVKEIIQNPIRYEEYWLLRGVYEDPETGYKKVEVEERFKEEPTEPDIVEFLIDNKDISFVSVEHNYRLLKGET